jgi:hypothetical protein
MAYQIKCDEYILYDPRDDELTLLSPKCKLAVNTVCGGSFTILPTHPYYSKLQKLKSIFEIRQDGETIFRGRMTEDSRDFQNCLDVDLEGVLAFANDSIIPPFNFPDDFPDAAESANVVEYLLGWVLDQHNAQCEPWQHLKLGTVTVADPNNYVTRSSEKYDTTWNILKSKFFDSALGGYLTMRYEDDGNYVDYLSEFTLTNTQNIIFGENLRDVVQKSDATATYSAILPLGANLETDDGGKYTVTLGSLPDGDLTDDLVKEGVFIYSKSAREQYGWKCMPISDTTWDDVTQVENLKTKAVETLSGNGVKLSATITFKGVDLRFTDDQIQSFRYARNVLADSPPHGITNAKYALTSLDIDILNPQSTVITVGDTIRTMTDVNEKQHSSTVQRVENAEKDIAENRTEVSEVRNQVLTQSTQILNDAEKIILGALESYVETGDYESFKTTVATQFVTMSDQISMNFQSTTEKVADVNGDLQKVIENLEKHFEFTIDGLVIKAGENSMKLTLDNGLIQFTKNGQPFGWWDGVDFHTGNIVVKVNERAQFGNFAFIPRSDGSLSFLKVGG